MWWEDQYESLSLSCYLLELSCQGSPCEHLSQQAGHRAAREEKMKPASWREVRETASNTLSLALSLRKHLELLAASSARLILAHRKRETAVTVPRQKKIMMLFLILAFLCPYCSFQQLYWHDKIHTRDDRAFVWGGGGMSRDL